VTDADLPDSAAATVPDPAPSKPQGEPEGDGARRRETQGNTGGGAPSRVPFLVRDLPLMALAFLIAVLLWNLVRDRLETEWVVSDVTVVVKVPPDVVVYAPRPITTNVTLRGPQGSVERARQALGNDPSVTLLLPLADVRPDQTRGTRQLYAPSDFVFPFEDTGVVAAVRAVTVDWERTVERDLPVARPSVLAPSDLRYETAQVTIDPPTVRVRGPVSLLEGLREARPDPLDAGAWLRAKPDLTNAFQRSLGFVSWHDDDVWAGRDRRDPKTLRIEPDHVQVSVKFREVRAEALSNVLRLVLPTEGPAALSDWVYEVKAGQEYDPATRRIRLPVRGDATLIEHLRQFPDDWSFSVAVPSPPAVGETVEDQPFAVRLLPVSQALRDKIRAAGGVPPDVEGDHTVNVTVKHR
jgi:hypothetical protein